MILVVGARTSGKRSFVMQEYGYQPEQIADAILDERPVICNLQDYLKANPDSSADPDSSAKLLGLLVKKEVVICNEIGSGIVPLQASEREWREATGRLCIALAEQAKQVVRIVCGLPTVLKDSETTAKAPREEES